MSILKATYEVLVEAWSDEDATRKVLIDIAENDVLAGAIELAFEMHDLFESEVVNVASIYIVTETT
jgi:hypothetical protein